MRWRELVLTAVFVLFSAGISAGAQMSDVSQPSLQQLLYILNATDSGKAILQKILHKWGYQGIHELEQTLRWGRVSHTDVMITRKWDPQTDSEIRERVVTIYLNQNIPIESQIMDLAHELTHASVDTALDPYDSDLDVIRYIRLSIEAPGGEVEAVFAECQVGFQLEDLIKSKLRRCERYRSLSHQQQRQLIQEDFYRMGDFLNVLTTASGLDDRQLPLLSSKKSVFFSSTGRVPYPLALYREYQALNQVACDNTRKRFQVVFSAPELMLKNQDFIAKRCSK